MGPCSNFLLFSLQTCPKAHPMPRFFLCVFIVIILLDQAGPWTRPDGTVAQLSATRHTLLNNMQAGMLYHRQASLPACCTIGRPLFRHTLP